MAHELCTEKMKDGQFSHECVACPHGLSKGFSTNLSGLSHLDERFIALKIQFLDSLTCESDHPDAIQQKAC